MCFAPLACPHHWKLTAKLMPAPTTQAYSTRKGHTSRRANCALLFSRMTADASFGSACSSPLFRPRAAMMVGPALPLGLEACATSLLRISGVNCVGTDYVVFGGALPVAIDKPGLSVRTNNCTFVNRFLALHD